MGKNKLTDAEKAFCFDKILECYHEDRTHSIKDEWSLMWHINKWLNDNKQTGETK